MVWLDVGVGHGEGIELQVTFFGVRGSTPCSSEANQRFGGNTSCVVVEDDGLEPIVLDLGTGLRFWGLTLGLGPVRATALVSHLHWDHIQGLPFFTPLHLEGSELHVIGPVQDGRTLEHAVGEFLCPPYFPVHLNELAGTVTFAEAGDSTFALGDATVTTRLVPHIGPTLGFRIESGGRSVVYVSDHQQPLCSTSPVDAGVLELCNGADLLIHDSQFTQAEFALKSDWGHCTIDYAIEVAIQSGVRRLALFHHDPTHDDDVMDALMARAVHTAARQGAVEIIAAREGLRLEL